MISRRSTPPGPVPGARLEVAFGFTRAPKTPLAYLPSGDAGMKQIERWLDFGL